MRSTSLRLAASVIACLLCPFLHAQDSEITLQGNIADAFLQCGIADCKIELMNADSTRIPSTPAVYNIDHGNGKSATLYFFTIADKAGDYLIRATKEGYSTGWGKVTVPAQHKETTFNVSLIEMRKQMATVRLGEAVVKATRIKVKMRGDTLVYDATAFNLPDGSMLQNLIEQLPGAKLTEQGEIFINGRKIDELTLNSRKLFGGDTKVLLENLPYFTVKELKVFERHSLQALMERDTTRQKEYVMDVNLKDRYSVGLISNINLAGGTHDRFLAKIFGFLLTKRLAIGAYANRNNIDDQSSPFTGGWGTPLHWGHGGGITNNLSAGTSIDYSSTEKGPFGFPNVSSKTDVKFQEVENIIQENTYRETFLPTHTAYSRTLMDRVFGVTELSVKEYFHHLPLNLSGDIVLKFNEMRFDTHSDLVRWDNVAPTVTQRNETKSKARTYGLDHLQFSFSLPWVKALQWRFSSSLKRTDREAFSRQVSREKEAVSNFRHEYQDARTNEYAVEPSVTYSFTPVKRLNVNVYGQYKKSGEKTTDNIFLLSRLDGWGLEDSVRLDLVPSNRELLWQVFDPANSVFSHLERQEGKISPSLTLLKGKRFPFSVTLTVPFFLQEEKLEYRRNDIDTTARRELFAVSPSLRIKGKDITIDLSLGTSSPGIMNTMPYRDERDPLYIVEGNPALKNNRNLSAYVNWNCKLNEERQNTMRLASSFNYYKRSVAQGFTYNTETGAYTYRPENVKGNWSWSTSHNLTLQLGNQQRWWMDNEVNANVRHSVDYTAMEHSPTAQLNRVETVNPKERLTLRYTGKHTKASLVGEAGWRRSWGHRPAQESVNAFDFRYGATASHTIEAWKTTFEANAFMYSRRGYASADMNKDECVVNASVKQALMRNKLTLKLEAYDIFHQLSDVHYDINAQGRTERWKKTMPNYVMLRLVYHFNTQSGN